MRKPLQYSIHFITCGKSQRIYQHYKLHHTTPTTIYIRMALRIAVAGATGELGIPIVMALLAAGYHVTALTREGSNNTSKLPTSSNLSVTEVDYSSVQSLATALKDHTVVVSTLTSTSVGDQNPLIDGAIIAGVARFIPSEFGSDVTNSKRNRLPVFEGKVNTHQYLKTIVAENPNFSYTVICNGVFLDWGLHGFLINVPGHTATVYNGGDIPFTATNLDTIVYIQDAVVTQNLLISYAKEKDGVEWDIRREQARIRSNIGGVLFIPSYAPPPAFAMKIRNNIFAAVAAFISINAVAFQWQPKVLCDNHTQIYAAAQNEHMTTADALLQVLMGGDAGSQGDAYHLSKYQGINVDLAYYGNRHIVDVVGLQTRQDFGR
ncbi:hypothetical protein MKX08_007255 [Trichoderma sp. CBMAI-0020]|nr:hypothetical protein MKX08_007255 [Trichoderma sp. CBMAI-0020]